MKKIILLLAIMIMISAESDAQLVQSNFTGVLVPSYIGSGTSSRLPFIYRATVTGLEPFTKYRYYSNACRYTDFGGTNSGAGNPIFINGSNYRYSTSTNLGNPSGYDSITTDASGSYTGWFGIVNTGNARFTAGNYVIPTITLDSAGNGSAKYRFALNDSIKVLGFSDSANSNSCTGFYGISLASPKNIVSVYDNVNNSGRPLTMVYVENEGLDTNVISSLAVFYKDSVDSRNGRWGTMIPNILSTGVRRVNVHRISDGSIANFNTDDDGIWPSGTSTINPSGGLVSPIRLSSQDIILSVKFDNTIPEKFSLNQNYPNPFNPSTNIDFEIPVSGVLKLKIMNILGEEAAVILNGYFHAGLYSVKFNAGNLMSGVYFYSLELNGEGGKFFKETKKLILIK
ncbi:MAG TPA: T9SS type A sorting domain-containing protein [Ignavibacteria bacterium]|nr:T9SS type A sorting domain-containing protein [Ignavibacteria bacterium]HRJ98740.1 T9SS type A sorting domain-containing protein [Ignavibacteria bacterium]